MTDLTFTLWNSCGLRATSESTSKKMGFFDKELPSGNFAVAVFVETHHRDEHDFPDLIREYESTHNVFHTPSPTDKTHCGVIVLIRKDLALVSHTIQIPGRLLNVKFKSDDTVFNVSAYYGPLLREIQKKDLYDLLRHFYTLHNRKDNNVLLGDFNFIDNDFDKGKGRDSHDRKIFHLWQDFKRKINVADPFREQFPTTRKYSFHSNCGQSRIDRMYVNVEHLNNIKNIKYKYYPQANTHKLLTFTFSSPDEKGHGFWKLNNSILNDPPFIKLITASINRSKELITGNPTDWWETLLINLRSHSLSYSIEKKRVERQLRKSWEDELDFLESIPCNSLGEPQIERLKTVQSHLKRFEEQEIEGHRLRTRNLPNFNKSEPNLSFYARLEKRFIKQTRISTLKDDQGKSVSQPQDLLRVISKFYTSLFTPSTTTSNAQKKLLKNVTKTLSVVQRNILDAPITGDELQEAVRSLNKDKSPGLNGLTSEFYQKFWPQLRYKYHEFINHAFHTSIPVTLNTSVTTLLYKERGDVDNLANYRPLSLINTDIKILSKVLTNRLKPMLPIIISRFQTAVFGRQIDHTVHLTRDLVDLANKEDLEAAFIFLDQEKAFDRVDHDFLYKTMNAFGISENFITWVKRIYGTAVTRVKVNGFLTDPIPLLRGVRQGDPLSFLLYVLNIELLSLILHANPNIVGFTIGGEKIVGMYYADDATITITQNRCFKEVIKDINTFEDATGAKVNLGKTKGLWTGKWKSRLDKPLGFTWTNKNVFHLGVYIGNDDPAKATFDEIFPKIQKSLNFWKSFRLSVLTKAKAVEVFQASQLLYAARFYCIPPLQVTIFQNTLFDYLNHPSKLKCISQVELQKLLLDGGVKLINLQLKSEASKVQWLMSLCTTTELSLHKALVERLFGVQKGGLTGIDLFFTTKSYAQLILKTNSSFYKEAVIAMTSLEPKKQIMDRYEEPIFYNRTFLQENERVIAPLEGCIRQGIFKYGQLILEQGAMNRGEHYVRSAITILDKIKHKDFHNRSEFQLPVPQGYIRFGVVTQKVIYEQLLKKTVYRDHHSTIKWVDKLNLPLEWEKIWKSVHNPLARDDTKSTIWAQIHLNDYTTASYNKWMNKEDPCPLCKGSIDDIFHIILHCPVTVQLWSDIEPFLRKITNAPVNHEEMAFGITGNSPPVILRNWLTFLLRQCILKQEKIAYHNNLGQGNTVHLRHAFNARVNREVCTAYYQLRNENRIDLFHKNYNQNRLLLINPNGDVERENIVKIL